MKKVMIVGVLLLAGVGVTAQDALKSGPQAGKGIPGAFHPLNCTGANADEKHCLV